MFNFMKNRGLRERANSESGASTVELILITAALAAIIFFVWRQFAPAIEDNANKTTTIIKDGHSVIGNR